MYTFSIDQSAHVTGVLISP